MKKRKEYGNTYVFCRKSSFFSLLIRVYVCAIYSAVYRWMCAQRYVNSNKAHVLIRVRVDFTFSSFSSSSVLIRLSENFKQIIYFIRTEEGLYIYNWPDDRGFET